MRNWGIALVALLTGLAGMVLAGLVADPLTRAYHVSDMEGQRGYLIVFIYAPAGFLLGALTGFLIARAGSLASVGSLARAQGIALLVVGLGIVGFGGLAWLAADRPPTRDGRDLEIELEIRFPLDSAVAADLHAADLHASLDENTRYNRFARLELDSAITRDGFLMVPGRASLWTRKPGRSLLVGMGTENAGVWDLPLPGKPRAADSAWTGWLAPARYSDPGAPPSERHYQIRYRVVPEAP